MAGSTRWLLTAVNMWIYILFWMLLAPLPAALFPGRVCSPCAFLLRFIAGWRTLSSGQVSPRDVSQQARKADGIAGMGHAEMDVPLQWRSLCSRRSHPGFLHHLYTRWQHITLLCSWSGFKGTNACKMQHSAEFQSVQIWSATPSFFFFLFF